MRNGILAIYVAIWAAGWIVSYLKGKRCLAAIVAVPVAVLVVAGRLGLFDSANPAIAVIASAMTMVLPTVGITGAVTRAKPGSWWAERFGQKLPVSSMPRPEAIEYRFKVATWWFTGIAWSLIVMMIILAATSDCEGVECDALMGVALGIMLLFFAWVVGVIVLAIAGRVVAKAFAEEAR